MVKKIFNYIQEVFSLNLQSLAIFRILLGSILFTDLCIQAFNVKDYYSDVGMLPRPSALFNSNAITISIHFISGLWEIQLLLVIVALISSVLLIIGYKTRLATAISWLLFFSLVNRNVWASSSADQLIRLVLFWSIFLPLGARFSIDSIYSKYKVLPKQVFSTATIAFTLQITLIYLFTAIAKSNPIWIKEGTAIFYALNSYTYSSYFGELLTIYFSKSFPYLTRLVYALEAFGIYFLYFPFKNGLIRTITIFVFIGMHTGIGIAMNLGTFPFIIVAAFIALLPTFFWDKLQKIINYRYMKKIIQHTISIYSLIPNFLLFQYIETHLLKKRISFKKTPPLLHLSKINSIFITICFFYVIYFNIDSLFPPKPYYSRNIVEKIGMMLELHQEWKMFALTSQKARENRWFIAFGRLKDGTNVNLLSYNQPINFDAPPHLPYQNAHQAKYFEKLYPIRYRYLAVHLCNKWNSSTNKKDFVENINLYMLIQKITLKGKQEKVSKNLVYQMACGKIPIY